MIRSRFICNDINPKGYTGIPKVKLAESSRPSWFGNSQLHKFNAKNEKVSEVIRKGSSMLAKQYLKCFKYFPYLLVVAKNIPCTKSMCARLVLLRKLLVHFGAEKEDRIQNQ